MPKNNPAPGPVPRYLTQVQAAAVVGCTVRTLQNYSHDGWLRPAPDLPRTLYVFGDVAEFAALFQLHKLATFRNRGQPEPEQLEGEQTLDDLLATGTDQ